jgi:hypothetical protein
VFTRASFVVEAPNPGIRQVADNGVPVAQAVAPATEADRIALQKKAVGRSGYYSGGLRKSGSR